MLSGVADKVTDAFALTVFYVLIRNCLFRALADQLEGDMTRHVHHRRETVRYIEEHRDEFAPFVEDDVPFDRHGECSGFCSVLQNFLTIFIFHKILSIGRKLLFTVFVKLRQDPLEAILVIFGRRALIFFLLFERSWKNLKMTPLLCACAVVITLETQRCWKRAPCSVEFHFFIIKLR